MNVASIGTLALEPFTHDPEALYSLDAAAHVAGISRRSVLRYCKWGLLDPIYGQPFGAMYFDAAAIRVLRMAEHLRVTEGVNGPGIRLIVSLLRELEERGRESRW